MVIIFSDFSMFYQIFLIPQVKQSAIIGNNNGIYELPHKLPNDLRLSKLGNIRKIFIELWHSVQPYLQNENFVNTTKQLLKNRIERFPNCAISQEN